ncbi:hypothetical protein RND81_11G134100 [Saponaria officinalis]|uniref:Protein kinase domain-containing protein n=1 Tax=Saponaria officinalis TaxID=3572 RepID=A0AAW1HLK3_SAPOF
MFYLMSFIGDLTVTIFIIILVLPSSTGVDGGYRTCISSLFSCGNVSNVGYPFWGDGRPIYCGLPDLQLQCIHSEIGDFPTLIIGSKDKAPYNVTSLKRSESNITLELQEFPNIHCTSYNKNISNIFKFSPSVENITFLYNCPSNILPRNSTNLVTCYEDQNHAKYQAYYVSNMSAHKEYSSCSSTVVPVFRKQLDLYIKGKVGSITQVLSQGFENGSSDYACQKQHTGSNSRGKRRLHLAIGIGGGILILIGLNIGLCYYLKLRFRSPVLLSRILSTDPMISDLETDGSFNGIPVFPYSELKEATNNFDASRELGDGGFGIVYYGKLRDGREVAVKRLYEKNYKQVKQFMNEVEILTRLCHPNLVTLYGCTSQSSRDLLLVYEYISNGTVADHLHGDRSVSVALTWAIRMKIAIETASALSYLHNSEIVHRDVKTNNILLTDNFFVKVADFGLSRLFPVHVTHVSTAPQGTPGYLDPEYHKCYQVTDKSDVYSFGVVLVELISSLPAVDITRQDDEINLSDYAMNRIQRGVFHELVDQTLRYNSDFKVQRMITLVAEVAFQCLQQEKDVRPSMTEVLETLVRIEGLDYEALEAEEMGKKRNWVSNDDGIDQTSPSPSSVVCN